MSARPRFDRRRIKATVFRAASIERFEDAECLHEGGRFQGAIYLCGYALECELKYHICEARRTEYLEEGEAKQLGHELFELLDPAGRAKSLAGNRDLWLAFQNITSQWSTDIRYSSGRSSRRVSGRFIKDSWDLMLWLKTESKS